MKKAIFSIAALALLLASCDTDTKDSYSEIPYGGLNLIIDTYDLQQPAIVSSSIYKAKTNLSKGVVDIKSSDIIVNNQKYSFETDTMALHYSTFKTLDGQSFIEESFSKKGLTAIGSAASDINGVYTWHYFRYSGNQYSPEVALTNATYEIGIRQGLSLTYTLSDRYKVLTFNNLVQTFSSDVFFRGNSYSNDESGSFSTKNTDYLVGMDFQKNIASVMIYNPEYSTNQPQNFPKIILLENMPIKYTHDRFYFEDSAPKTKVLTTKDGKTEFSEDPSIKVTEFSLTMLSESFTDIDIKYVIDGKSVSFIGCSIVKSGK